jgi:peptidoglycan/LPS O-acetylase OafA/YrhL
MQVLRHKGRDSSRSAPEQDSFEVLKHISALDGVRGLAIILVLVNHLLWSSPNTGSRLLNFVVGLREAAWIGVDLFFALSGFLITGILFDTLQTKHYFKNFYARRALRIFPLYYGVIFVLFVILHGVYLGEYRQLNLLPFYLQNTSLWWNGSQNVVVKDLTGHLWSLAVEEQFYLVWPILIFFIRNRRALLWTSAVLALLAPIVRIALLHSGAPFDATYKLTICRADSLLAGAWLALILRGPLRTNVQRYAAPVFLLAALCCVGIALRAGTFDWEASYAINSIGYTVIAIAGAAWIAMALRPGSLVSRAMNVGLPRWMGKYSYGIYVYHQIVTFPAGWIFTVLLAALHIQSKSVAHILSMGVNLCMTIPLAVLSFHLYEQPFLKLKRYFSEVPAAPAETSKEEPESVLQN